MINRIKRSMSAAAKAFQGEWNHPVGTLTTYYSGKVAKVTKGVKVTIINGGSGGGGGSTTFGSYGQVGR